MKLWHRLFGHGVTYPSVRGSGVLHFWGCGRCRIALDHNNKACPGPKVCCWYEEEE